MCNTVARLLQQDECSIFLHKGGIGMNWNPGSSRVWIGTAMLATVLFMGWVSSFYAIDAGKGTSASTPRVPNFQAPGGGSVSVDITPGERVTVSSDYWRLEYDLRKGGVLDSIVFLHGSGRNLLAQPFRTSVDQWSDANAPHVEYRSSREGDVLRLEFSGQMATADRRPGPVGFETTWTLSPFVVRADHTIRFSEGMGVSTVDIASTSVLPQLDEFGLRVGPPDDPDDRKYSLATFGKTRGAGTQLIEEHHAPIYMFFFNRGVEGFGLTTASDLAAWENGLTGRGGVGRYSAQVAENGTSIQILREPLSAMETMKVPKGDYTFSYYLGLPRIVEKANRKWRHLAFDNHHWPSEEEIKRWADNGVNVVRLHNDYYPDEDFWHDGAWPPYDEKGMEELRRVIATCHRYKILVVPYFSVHEFHPKAAGYSQHGQEWARTNDELGTFYHNTIEKGEFGAEMCPQSGWLERLKSDIERAYREFGFDGIYYDETETLPCNNKNHDPKVHLGTDGIIDLMAWTRRLVAPKNGILIIHQYGPISSISIENFGDLIVNMEELQQSEELLRIDKIPVVTELAESLPRSACPFYGLDRAVERNEDEIAHLVLFGMFPWGAAMEMLDGTSSEGGATEALEMTLKLFHAFQPYKLEDYRLYSPFSGAVHTAWEDVYGAVYAKADQALVVISNTRDKARKSVVWTVKPENLGFGLSPTSVTVKDAKSGKVQTLPLSGLQDGSLSTELGGYEYRIFEVRPAP